MNVIFRRLIALAMFLVFAFISCAVAEFIPSDLISAIGAGNGYHLELNIEVISHMPFSQERLSSLNELFRYITVDADVCGKNGSAILKINGDPQLTLVHKEEDNETLEWTDALPRTVLIGNHEADLPDVYAHFSNPLNEMGLQGDEYDVLVELGRMLNEFPVFFPDVKQKEEKIRVKIGDFGIAKRKRTLVISSEIAKQNELFRDIIVANCTNQRMRTWLETIIFSGRQTLTQYLDEGEQIIRNVYAGNVRYTDGRIHNVNLSWKSLKSEKEDLNEIKMKSPAASGNDRDDLTLTLNMNHENWEHLGLTLEYDFTKVRGKEKDIFQGATELVLTSGEKTELNGEISFNRKHNQEKKQGWVIKPEVTVDNHTKELKGQFEVKRCSGETAPECALIHFSLQNGAEIVQMPDNITEKIFLTDERSLSEIETLITDAAAKKLIVPLLKLPDQALSFFREGLSENQWNQIIRSIQ